MPTAGCWAFTYIDPIQTSTIVVAIEPELLEQDTSSPGAGGL